ncbi:hypothetical protein L484_014027 [Morus notabilis]|uniref:Glycine-rich protein n=1 Tax=Morus notabilis TaxID=981085 RepID=W9RJT1_9ROSA|nr:hypothetical protein L484_014027 [Morus notabilis]
MAYSKAFILLALAFAVVLLISLEVSVHHEFAEIRAHTTKIGKCDEANYGDRFGGHESGHSSTSMTGRGRTGSNMPGHGCTGSDMPGRGQPGHDMPAGRGGQGYGGAEPES